MTNTKHTPATQVLNDFHLSNAGKTFTLGGGIYTKQVWLDQHIPTIMRTLENYDEMLKELERAEDIFRINDFTDHADRLKNLIARVKGETQ